MGKEINITKKRDETLETIRQLLAEKFETDCLYVDSGVVMMPGIDDEGNEFYYKIQVSIPRGERTGLGGYTPWDGYAEAEVYKAKVEADKAKKKAKEEEKKRKEEEKERKKKARQTIKKLNKDGLNKMIHEGG